MLSWAEEFFLKRALKSIVRQGGHRGKITDLYYLINSLAQYEFDQESLYSTDLFLYQCFKDSLNSSLKKELKG